MGGADHEGESGEGEGRMIIDYEHCIYHCRNTNEFNAVFSSVDPFAYSLPVWSDAFKRFELKTKLEEHHGKDQSDSRLHQQRNGSIR